MPVETFVVAAVAGVVVGMLVGLTGMGGGSLVTPFLILVGGVKPAVAVGTDLVYSAVTKWTGALVHIRQKTFDGKIAFLLASGSVPASLLGAWSVDRLGDAGDLIIERALGVTLVIVAAGVVAGRISKSSRSAGSTGQVRSGALVGLGAVVGFLVGITSVGSGTLVIAVLLIAFPSLPPARLVGTDLLQAALLTSTAGLAYAGFGNVDFQLAGALLVGSLPGVVIGSRLSPRVPSNTLKLILGVVVGIVGLRLLWPS